MNIERDERNSGMDPQEVGAEDPIMPKCPHCGMQPARVISSPFQLTPGLLAVTVYCADPECAKILAIQIVQQIRPQDDQSVLVDPRNGGPLRMN